MQRPRPADLPLLVLVGARAARRRRRSTRRASTSTRASSTSCSTPASSRGSRCTTGTCRRRSRTRGGWAEPRHRRTCSPTTRSTCTTRSATGSTLDDAQRAVVLVVPQLHGRRARARAAGRGRRLAAATTCCSATAWPCRRCASATPTLELGITLNLTVAKPVDPTHPGDVDAARRIDGQFNRFFLDPIFRGRLPGRPARGCRGTFGPARYVMRPATSRSSRRPIDALGVNYYHGEPQRPAPRAGLAQWRTGNRPHHSVSLPGPRRTRTATRGVCQ